MTESLLERVKMSGKERNKEVNQLKENKRKQMSERKTTNAEREKNIKCDMGKSGKKQEQRKKRNRLKEGVLYKKRKCWWLEYQRKKNRMRKTRIEVSKEYQTRCKGRVSKKK